MKQEKLDGLVTAPAGIDLVSQVQEVTFCNWFEDLSFRKSQSKVISDTRKALSAEHAFVQIVQRPRGIGANASSKNDETEGLRQLLWLMHHKLR